METTIRPILIKQLKDLNSLVERSEPIPAGQRFLIEDSRRSPSDLSPQIFEKYFIQLVLKCERDCFEKHVTQLPSSPIHLEKVSPEKHEEIGLASIEEDFFKRFSSSLNENIIQWFRNASKLMFRDSSCLFVSYEGVACGGVSLRREKSLSGEVLNSVAWIWISDKFPKNVRTASRKDLLTFVLKNIDGPVFCGVYALNEKSLRFFERVGFELKSVLVFPFDHADS